MPPYLSSRRLAGLPSAGPGLRFGTQRSATIWKVTIICKPMLNKFFCKHYSGVPLHAWLLLCGICLVGYWPVSSNLFSLKNDAYVYFLPCRHFISESIQSGHLPLWDPYFYMGFPLHGDIQGGVWNPVVLLISLAGRYNMSTLQYETLLYIFVAGLGMYKLLSITSSSHLTKLISATAYMFCGFIINSGQITVWVASAAFLPFIFLYYHRVLYQRELVYKNAIKTSVAFYLLFTAGYPSILIASCYVLIFSLLVFCVAQAREKSLHKIFVTTLIKANILIAITFLLISLPALLSYIDYLPYYQRAGGTTLAEAQQNPFNLFASISYFFPLSVTREHPYLPTDPTARSAYIGLFTIVLLAGILRKKLSPFQILILVITLFAFGFSLGNASPVREFCYRYIPLMNLFRHPGTMRIFTTLGLLIVSSFYLDDLWIALQNKTVKYYCWLTSVAAAFTGIVVLIYLRSSSLPARIISFKNSYTGAVSLRLFVKEFYTGFTFADAIVAEGILQLFFLLAFFFLIQKKRTTKIKWIVALLMINPILLAQFSIPATFVTQKSPSKINRLIAASPANYPIPDVHATIEENNAVEKATKREYGAASVYTKKIVWIEEGVNPSFTKSLDDFGRASAINSIVFKYPVCYFADTLVRYTDSLKINHGANKILFTGDTVKDAPPHDTTLQSNQIKITQFAPWGLFFQTNTLRLKPFVLFQNYNKNWQLFIDGKKAEIKKGNISFMYADIKKGQHQLQFFYRPPYIIYAFPISLITILLIAVFLLWKVKRERIN